MTTKGRGGWSHKHSLGELLKLLPEIVERREAEGLPVVVTMPPTLEPHQQRMLATLGVLVRFDNDSDLIPGAPCDTVTSSPKEK